MINPAPIPLYCSDECRLADLHSYYGTITYPDQRAPSFPPTPPNSGSDINVDGSEGDSNLSGASLKSGSSTLSSAPTVTAMATTATTTTSAIGVSLSTQDCGADAYMRLSAIYGFAPLPPPPPVVPRITAPPMPPPPLQGGIMMAACRMQAALCTKTVKLVCGQPVDTNPEDDNKPIPGWTDGSNAWQASTYGLAPPFDFTRPDPDDAAIRAYGSFVATSHRSHTVNSTPDVKPATSVKTGGSSQSFPSPPMDATTQRLYQQFFTAISERYYSRRQASMHPHIAALSTSNTGLAHTCLVHEVPLVKPGAEGLLEVQDVKMHRTVFHVSRVAGGNKPSTACNATCSVPPVSTPGPAGKYIFFLICE